VERDDAGRILLSEEEAETIRAALFVVVDHSDDIVGHCEGCFQSITGVEKSALAALMQDLDELSGRNARLDEWMSAELEKRASWDDDALAAATYLPDMLRIARERGLHVPPRLRDL
jgi:hypothetical protein